MNTPSSSFLLRLCLGFGACFVLSSCYYGSGYGGSYGSSYGGYGSGYRPVYSSFGGGYRSYRCNRCGHSPCRCSNHRSYRCSRCGSSPCRCSHGSQRYDKHKSHSKSEPHKYKIAGGSVGTKTKPTGAHSYGWYKSRGYDTSRLVLKDQHGHVKKGSNYKSSSSSSSRSYTSSSSRSNNRNRSASRNNNSHRNASRNNNNRNKASRNRNSGGNNRNRGGGGKNNRKKK